MDAELRRLQRDGDPGLTRAMLRADQVKGPRVHARIPWADGYTTACGEPSRRMTGDPCKVTCRRCARGR